MVRPAHRPGRTLLSADELTGHTRNEMEAAGADDDRSIRLRVDEVDDPITHLLRGEIEVEGRMPYSSNATYLVHVVHEGLSHPAIYKPLRGERPLWDFEPGLHRREVAAYRLSEALGVGVVPPTVLRDGPLGEGSIQWFVTADHSEHYFTIYETEPGLHDRLRDIAVLDILANNTDRKSGHCLLVPAREDRRAQVWAIDNGLCFAPQSKLRTVIWEFADEPLPDRLARAAGAICERVPLDVAALLADDEVEAIRGRAAQLLDEQRFPVDETGRRYPWPII